MCTACCSGHRGVSAWGVSAWEGGGCLPEVGLHPQTQTQTAPPDPEADTPPRTQRQTLPDMDRILDTQLLRTVKSSVTH